ncbi:asparagine synthase-related protein [Alphaproteobacteria bacterium]|nr:asparagine synthase-related protein [Alphaproteobacteria bacterium]
MGKIAGIQLPGENAFANDKASTMLQSIGVKRPTCLLSCASSDKEGFATLGKRMLVLDGVIYNPEDFSAKYKRHTDSELILISIEKIGLQATLRKINGDFALALIDQHSGSLTLARDRFGIRPLYFSSKGPNRGFSSSIRSLLNLSFVSKKINPTFLKTAAALNYRFLDTHPNRTPFLDVVQVPPGSIVEFKKGSINNYSFYEWQSDEKRQGLIVTETDYIELFEDSVARRLKKSSDPIFTLSGGLDSSAVIAMAHKITGIPQPAISSIHEDKSFDEKLEIMDIVNSSIVEWEAVSIDNPNIFDLLEKVTPHHEYPIPTATWLNHFILTEKAKQLGYRSLFTGLGGDELNAGEYDYFFYFFADLKHQKKDALLRQEIEAWIRNHNHPIFQKSENLAMSQISKLTSQSAIGNCNPDIGLLYKYQKILHSDLTDLTDVIPTYNATSDSYLLSHSRNELLQTTMPCCLRASHLNSSAMGISDFHPFLDYRLFELMGGVPSEQKIRNGITKAFARRAYKGLLPEATRTRITKKGWNAPAHQWFANQGRKNLLDLISSRQFIERGIYNQKELHKVVNQHFKILESGKNIENHMMVIWQIVSLEIWLRNLDSV